MANPYLPPNQGAALGLAAGDQADLVTVTTPSGATFRVARKVAPQFQGFLNELSSKGYPINPQSSGGYNNRNVFGTPYLSQHAYGNAVDVNWDANPRGGGGSNLPPDVGDVAANYGLAWGGDWKNPDPMHFEASRYIGDAGGAAGSTIGPKDDTGDMSPAKAVLANALRRTNRPTGPSTAPGTAQIAAPAAGTGTGLDRLTAALAGKAYDPDKISTGEQLMQSGQRIGENAINPIGAIGATLVSGLGGAIAGSEEEDRKAFNEQLRTGLASSPDAMHAARLLMSSPDAKQQTLGIELLTKLQTAAARGGQEDFNKNIVYGTNEQGETVPVQFSDKGHSIQTQLPAGVKIGKDPIKVDAGTDWILLDPVTRQPIGKISKNVATEAQQKEVGKVQGENIAKKPDATLRIGNAFNNFDRLADAAKAIRDAPGLSSNYGMYSYIPNRRGSEAGTVAADLISLKSQIANTVLQSMREASKTGGAVGNVSDAEQVLFQNNLAALDAAQSPEAVKGALDRIIDWANGSKERVGRAYQETYGEPYQASPSTSTPSDKVLKYNRQTGKFE